MPVDLADGSRLDDDFRSRDSGGNSERGRVHDLDCSAAQLRSRQLRHREGVRVWDLASRVRCRSGIFRGSL